MCPIALGEPLDDYGVSTRGNGWKEREVHRLAVNVFDLYTLYLGQLLESALYLHCLGGLVAEALDEVLGSL